MPLENAVGQGSDACPTEIQTLKLGKFKHTRRPFKHRRCQDFQPAQIAQARDIYC